MSPGYGTSEGTNSADSLRRRGRSRLVDALVFLPLFMPAVTVAQDVDARARVRLDSLLTMVTADSLIQGLGDRFTRHFLLMVPDLASAENDLLSAAVELAFDPAEIRADMAAAIATDLEPDAIARLLETQRTGAHARMGEMARRSTPSLSLTEFVGQLDEEERARLQLMVALVEVQGRGDFELLLDESVRRVAHQVVNALGGTLGPFQPIPDDQFEAGYRQQTITLALESLYRYQTVPEELLIAAIDEYDSPEGSAFVDARATSTLSAVRAAGQRVADLTVPAEEPAVEAEEAEVDPGLPCRGRVCGLVVDWSGPPPTGTNRRFGAARELDIRVLRHLVSAGYRLHQGTEENGMTIRLTPRRAIGLCEVTAGWYNTACTAIGDVRIDFLGSSPDHDNPDRITVRNRCGADGIMGIEGISAYVAMHLHLALTPVSDDERTVPNC